MDGKPKQITNIYEPDLVMLKVDSPAKPAPLSCEVEGREVVAIVGHASPAGDFHFPDKVVSIEPRYYPSSVWHKRAIYLPGNVDWRLMRDDENALLLVALEKLP